jgi:hypothetical protein
MMPTTRKPLTDEKWLDFWRHYKGEPHQEAAVLGLGQRIRQLDGALLDDQAEWVGGFRNGPQSKPAAVAPSRPSPSSPFSALLTPNFRLGEFALGREERRFHHQHQVTTAIELATFMERARAHFGGRPVIITSGYRPPAINRSVNGASGSEHLFSAPGVGAVDWLIQGVSVLAVQDWCDQHWPFSLGYGAPKGFVHLGIRSGRPRVRWNY